MKNYGEKRKRKLYNYIFNKNVILSGYRGSISHGLYIAPKDNEEFGICDTDLFEIYCFPKEYYLALEGYYHSKEVSETKHEEIDSVEYEVRKAMHLLAGCNPNVIGWLYSKPEHYTTISEGGKLLLKNRSLFLGRRRVRDAFSGYAYSQLKRLTEGAFKGYMGEKRKKIVIKYGYDTKNASTLIRLLRHGAELLKTGEMKTYRDEDRQFLLDIKQGKYSLNKLQKIADKEFKLVEEAYEKSELPLENNRNKISELLVKIFELEFAQ